MKTLTTLLSLVALGLSCQVQAEPAAKDKQEARSRDCLFANQPQSWKVLDREHLVIWGPTRRDSYLVTLFAPMTGINFAETLAFIDDDHDGMICGNGGDKIGVPDRTVSSFPTTITSMRKVDNAELLALGEQYKVKLLSDKQAAEVKQHDKQIHDGKTQ